MIEFKNIQIKYGDFIAIDNLNLTINEGEFFTFLGPSGCGKTTTLRALVGFNTPTSGEIIVDGNVINNVSVEKRGIGIVFQSYALFPSMSVYDNIAFGLKIQKCSVDEIKKRVTDVADKVSLTKQALMRNVSELSGGRQQRVALARAIILEPKILCLDEPLSNLDARLRVNLRGELKRLQRELGITTLYVTHDQEEALTMSDRVAVFNNGFIEQLGTPYEIYNNSASRFVCDFIGSINTLKSDIITEINKTATKTLDAAKDGFIRLELIGMQATHPHDVELTAKVINYEYNGIMTRYYFETANQTVQSLQINSSPSTVKIGDTVKIYINSKDIMQFAEG